MHANENQELSAEQENELQNIKIKSKNLIRDIEAMRNGWETEQQGYQLDTNTSATHPPTKAQTAALFAISYADTAREFLALAAGSSPYETVLGFYDLGAEFFVAAKRSMDIARELK